MNLNLTTRAAHPVVHLDNVSKTYRTGETEVHAVRGVSFTIERGEFVAFMGTSGSGKGTLMNVLGCLDRPTSGRYLLDGGDVSQLGRDALAAVRHGKLGFVSQSFNLLARTSALENVELPLFYGPRRPSRRQSRERASRALAQVGLGGRAGHYPNQLSGGQQQRVAVARALVNEPEVILADEPTGSLDARTSIEIMGVFQRLNDAGITVIMVTHEPEVASYATRTVVMRDGRVCSDTPVTDRRRAEDELAHISRGEREEILAAVSAAG